MTPGWLAFAQHASLPTFALATLLLATGALFKAAPALQQAWLNHLDAKRKQTDEVALALVATLSDRVTKLEGRLDTEREQFAAEMKVERDRCDVQLGLIRHSVRGWKQIVYSLLHVIALPASQQRKAIDRIQAEIAVLEQAEATEKGAVAAAIIAGGLAE